MYNKSQRNPSFFSSIGSVGRNLKRLVTLSALLFSAEAKMEHAKYKARIHKSMIKNAFDTNFPVILQQLDQMTSNSKYLTEINAQIDRLSLNIAIPSNYNPEDSDIMLDGENIIITVPNLAYNGRGSITDPETNVKERIIITSELEPLQIVFKLGTQEDQGNIYPAIETVSTKVKIIPGTIVVDAKGDLPLYKAEKFNDGIKSWLASQAIVRETEFKTQLQKAERQIFESFTFKQNFDVFKDEDSSTNVAHSHLDEKMSVQGDHLVLNFSTEYTGRDLSEVSEKLRSYEPVFSDAPEHNRDVQVVFDENQINHFLYTMFYADKPFSLAEVIIGFLPEQFAIGGPILKQIFNAQTFSVFFPELKKYGQKKIDLQCSLSKDYLSHGNLHSELSTIKYLGEDTVKADLNFGCAVLLYGSEGDDKKDEVDHQLDQLFDLFNQFVQIEDNKNEWRTFRKFFISIGTKIKFDFSEDAKELKIPYKDQIDDVAKLLGLGAQMDKMKIPKLSESLPFIFAKVVDFEPTIHEVKIFKEDKELYGEMYDEAQYLNQKIYDMRNHDFWEQPLIQPIVELLFGNAIPVMPYPNVENCLGFQPGNSHMNIHEGYAVMSIDYSLKQSHKDCLFRLKEWKAELKQKQMRRMKGRPPMPGQPGVPMDLNPGKVIGEKIKQMADKEPIVGEVMKNVQGIMKDENMQKMAKNMIKGPMKGLNDLNNQLNPTKLLGSLFQ